MATGCLATKTVTVNPVPTAITGVTTICVASSTVLSDGVSGGTWSSSNSTIATIGMNTGIVGGVTSGSVNITYTLGAGCITVAGVTVQPIPLAISGSDHVCFGATTPLSDAPAGGVWSSDNTSVATIAATGVVTGVTPGVAVISYSLGTGCTITMSETVNPVLPITGTTVVCAGQTTTLSDALAGGAWSSGNAAIANVNAANGIVTGVSGGTTNIIYTLPTGCTVSIPVTINPLSSIVGAHTVCIGFTTLLNNAILGGTWSSGSTGVATVNSSGLVTGVTVGTVTINYTMATGCMATTTMTVISVPAAITGNTNVCIGATTYLSDITPGGTWSNSASSGILVIGASTGAVTGLAIGAEAVTYSAGGCIATTTVTVHTPPAGISGASFICAGSTTTYSNTTPGGVWSTGNTAIATITPSTGALTAVSAGVTMITYSTGAGCITTVAVVVNTLPQPIIGAASVCAGGSTTNVSDATPGGTWNSTVVTISPTGVVTGYISGTAIITYTLPTGCFTTAFMSVSPLPAPITGAMDICLGASSVLSDASPGGIWSSANPSVVSIGAGNGHITGLAAGTAIVSYMFSTGCAVTASVTVHPLPPLITGNTNVCVASTTVLSDGVSGGAWSSGSTVIAMVGISSGIVSGMAPGAANITYTLPTGCFTFTSVTVNPLPVGVTGINHVCIGGTTILSDFPTGGTWSSANTSIAAVDLYSGVVSGVSVSVTTLTYTIGTGCIRTVPFTVNPLPPAITGPAHVCSGSTITLSDASGGGTWSSGNIAVASVGLTTGVVTGGSASTATITYTLVTGCTASTSVTVYPPPAVYNITGGGTFCALDTGIHIGLNGSGFGFTYRLYRASTLINTLAAGTGSAITFGLQTTAGTYVVTASNNITGCSAGMTGSAVITVIPAVTPAVSIIVASGTVLCSGTMTAFTAVPVNGGTSPAFQWEVNGVNAAAINPYHYIPSNGDVVTCILTSNAVCATTLVASSSVTLTVTTKQMPVVNITAMPSDTVCAGTTVTYLPAPVFGGTVPAYIWKRNGVNAGTGPSYNYMPADGDSISCIMVSNYPCVLADSVWSNEIIMSVAPLFSPSVTITALPGTTIVQGQSDTLTAIVTNGGPSPAYQWFINGLPVPGATLATYVGSNFSNLDSVSCDVTGSGLCGTHSSSSVIIYVNNVGVTQITSGYGDIHLVPNPNKGEFTIRGSLAGTAGGNEEVVLEITDMLGQVVYRNTAIAKNGKINEHISLGNTLANGMYILNLHSVNENRVFHFVIEQ